VTVRRSRLRWPLAVLLLAAGALAEGPAPAADGPAKTPTAEATAEKASAKKKPTVFRIKNDALLRNVVDERPAYPKYATQLINLANQNAQATRPRHVGQLSELIQAFDGESYDEWAAWYEARHPQAIDQATDRIVTMLDNLRDVSGEIDRDMVRAWVADLILAKTYVGLTYQEAILRSLASRLETDWRLAEPADEAKGIDGYVGDRPVSVKPLSYQSKAMLNETIAVSIVYYEKVKGGLRVLYNF
jgi:hypothetical protein